MIYHTKYSFNSRPHKEVDLAFRKRRNQALYLSIHDLTRRSTSMAAGKPAAFALSIHDLTRRSTGLNDLISQMKELSIHDLTRRSTIFPLLSLSVIMLSIHDLTRRSTFCSLRVGKVGGIFQLTTSQGGRRTDEYGRSIFSIFQFTTSQGGRRCLSRKGITYFSSFNSRPHKEVDDCR